MSSKSRYRNIIYITTIAITVSLTSIILYQNKTNTSTVATQLKQDSERYVTLAWGQKYECSEDVIKLLNTKVMQRLKHIDQHGPCHIYGHFPAFSRYTHSCGVYALLHKAGVSKKEQIAGLFHDSSHSVFSHVSDYLYVGDDVNKYTHDAYHDSQHMVLLKKNNVDQDLEQLGYSLTDMDIDNKDNKYYALERSVPEMCADRIEYNISTAYLFGLLTANEAKAIFDDLQYDKEQQFWYFTSEDLAYKLATTSLYFTQNFWTAKWNVEKNIHLAKALNRAMQLGIITHDELFNTVDADIYNKLAACDDPIVQAYIDECKSDTRDHSGNKKYKKTHFTCKFRGINPRVGNNGRRLSDSPKYGAMFMSHYEYVKKSCQEGFDVEVLEV